MSIPASIGKLPYSTPEELQAVEGLTSKDIYVTITLSQSLSSAAAMQQLRTQLRETIPAKYPNYEFISIDSSSFRIQRNDVLAELERRTAIRQAEKAEQERQAELQKQEADARVAEIEALLQEAIQNGSAARYSFTVPKDYTYAEIQQACKNMRASDYRFGDYTKDDYSLSLKSSNKTVTISNYKWQAEEQARQEQAKQEEQARIEALSAEIVAYCYEAMADFPTIEELQSVANLTSEHSHPYIQLPSNLRSTDAMKQAQALMEANLSAKYPDYEMYRIMGWGFEIQRNDVLAEMERRKTAAQEEQEEQEEQEAHIAEVEEPIQEDQKPAASSLDHG